MAMIQIMYNPHRVETEIWIDGKSIDGFHSRLAYIQDKRICDWFEPSGNWPGFFSALPESTDGSMMRVEFIGTDQDFLELKIAKEKLGDLYDGIALSYKPKDDFPAKETKPKSNPARRKDASIPEFRILVVGTMSSGKSTLINAFIGRDLLPEANTAMTAVLTEVWENSSLSGFLVSAFDEDGECVKIDGDLISHKEASQELIQRLNDEKDSEDPEKTLVSRIQLEGPIPHIHSDKVKVVFVDTPGGNSAFHRNHAAVMEAAMKDERNSLILVNLDGSTLGTEDSKKNLNSLKRALNVMGDGKIEETLQNRILFVANKMEKFDSEKASYDDVVQSTILPFVKSLGITKPNLYLVSSKTAKLIRTSEERPCDKTKQEKGDRKILVDQFNDFDYYLPKYASLNSNYKSILKDEADQAVSENNMEKVAEIYSGIPALELAIGECLGRYAFTNILQDIQCD